MTHIEALEKVIKLQEEKIVELEKQLKEKTSQSITYAPFNGTLQGINLPYINTQPLINNNVCLHDYSDSNRWPAICKRCGSSQSYTVTSQNMYQGSNVDQSRFNR